VPLDRNRHKTAHRVQRLPGHHRTGNSEACDCTHTKTHRNKVESGAGSIITSSQKCRLVFARHQRGAVARTIENLSLCEETTPLHLLQNYPQCNWVLRSSLNDIALAQQFLAKLIEPLDLMPPAVCFVSLFPDAR